MLYGKQEKNTGSGKFGRWLNAHMEEKGYSRRRLANQIGVGPRAVLYYVEGKRFPKMKAILKLINIFQCDETIQDIYAMIEEDRDAKRCPKTKTRTWILGNMTVLEMNQMELARYTGISQPSISMHINGKALPSIKTIDKYCAIFGEKDRDSVYRMVLEDMYPTFVDMFDDKQKAALFLMLTQKTEEELE